MGVTLMQGSIVEILELVFLLPLLWCLFYLIKNRKHALDIYNRLFKRNRCIHVRFITRTKTEIDRYLVPDSFGFVTVDKAMYHYLPDYSHWNAKLRMRSIVLIENQIPATSGKLAKGEGVKLKVTQKDPTTGLMKERLETVPQYVVDVANVHPELVVIEDMRPNEEGELVLVKKTKTARALHEFSQQHVATDITEASSPAFQRLKQIVILSACILGVLIIAGYLGYQKLTLLQDRLTEMEFLLHQVAGAHRTV